MLEDSLNGIRVQVEQVSGCEIPKESVFLDHFFHWLEQFGLDPGCRLCGLVVNSSYRHLKPTTKIGDTDIKSIMERSLMDLENHFSCNNLTSFALDLREFRMPLVVSSIQD